MRLLFLIVYYYENNKYFIIYVESVNLKAYNKKRFKVKIK